VSANGVRQRLWRRRCANGLRRCMGTSASAKQRGRDLTPHYRAYPVCRRVRGVVGMAAWSGPAKSSRPRPRSVHRGRVSNGTNALPLRRPAGRPSTLPRPLEEASISTLEGQSPAARSFAVSGPEPAAAKPVAARDLAGLLGGRICARLATRHSRSFSYSDGTAPVTVHCRAAASDWRLSAVEERPWRVTEAGLESNFRCTLAATEPPDGLCQGHQSQLQLQLVTLKCQPRPLVIWRWQLRRMGRLLALQSLVRRPQEGRSEPSGLCRGLPGAPRRQAPPG